MKSKLILPLLCVLLVTACAQVPRESVELSTTIGRDLETVHKAHRELAGVIFTRMRNDINRFVDEVYAPHQINFAMSRQNDLARSSDPNKKKASLLLAINNAFKDGADPGLQRNVVTAMSIFVRSIRKDVEAMRKELLDPVEAQEAQVHGSIDRAYQQLHYANSIVTGHLASVVKVHEAQAELLDSFGVERDLRKDISTNLAKAAGEINKLVEKAEKTSKNFDKAKEHAAKIKAAVKDLKKKINPQR